MRIFKIDMLRIVSSIKFWVAVLSVVIIGVLSAYMMNQMLQIPKNGFWIFIDAVLLDGFLAAVSPAIVVLPFSTSLFNDINSKNSNNIVSRIPVKKYFTQRFFFRRGIWRFSYAAGYVDITGNISIV